MTNLEGTLDAVTLPSPSSFASSIALPPQDGPRRQCTDYKTRQIHLMSTPTPKMGGAINETVG